MSRLCMVCIPVFVVIMCCESFGWLRGFRPEELAQLDPLYCSTDPAFRHELLHAPVYAYMVNDSGSYYYAGNTPSLNRFLERLAKKIKQLPAEQWYKRVSARLVIHPGVCTVKSPVPDLNLSVRANWRLEETPSIKVLDSGKKLINEQSYAVHVWIGEAIELERLEVPEGVKVESGGEIEQFIKKSQPSESKNTKVD